MLGTQQLPEKGVTAERCGDNNEHVRAREINREISCSVRSYFNLCVTLFKKNGKSGEEKEECRDSTEAVLGAKVILPFQFNNI